MSLEERFSTTPASRIPTFIFGIVDIVMVMAVLLLVGALMMWLWFCKWMGIEVPMIAQKIYIGVIALIGLCLLVAHIFDIHPIKIIGID